MMSNKIYISAAGSGKTTFILNQAINQHKQGLPDGKRILIVTFTNNNQINIRDRILNQYGYIPRNIEVSGWYSFVLDYWIRPFKGTVLEQLYECHIGLSFVEGISGTKKLPNGKIINTYHNDTEKFLCKKQNGIYSDKLSEFAFKCWENNKNELIDRLSNIVDTLYIDEVQDLAAWDYELMKILLKSNKIKCVLCGDPRQHTFSTTSSSKNKKYQGNIALYVEENVNTKKKKYVEIDTVSLNKSHRCGMDICTFASTIIPMFPPTEMCTCTTCLARRDAYTYPQGIFLVKIKDVQDYVNLYNPLSLVWNRATKIEVQTEKLLNWGESKGLQSDSTLIYLTDKLIEAYNSKGRINIPEATKRKFYVAVTRAKFTVGLVVPDDFDNTHIKLPFWKME